MIVTVCYSSFHIGRIQVFQDRWCPGFKIRFREHRSTYFDAAVFTLN